MPDLVTGRKHHYLHRTDEDNDAAEEVKNHDTSEVKLFAGVQRTKSFNWATSRRGASSTSASIRTSLPRWKLLSSGEAVEAHTTEADTGRDLAMPQVKCAGNRGKLQQDS